LRRQHRDDDVCPSSFRRHYRCEGKSELKWTFERGVSSSCCPAYPAADTLGTPVCITTPPHPAGDVARSRLHARCGAGQSAATALSAANHRWRGRRRRRDAWRSRSALSAVGNPPAGWRPVCNAIPAPARMWAFLGTKLDDTPLQTSISARTFLRHGNVGRKLTEPGPSRCCLAQRPSLRRYQHTENAAGLAGSRRRVIAGIMSEPDNLPGPTRRVSKSRSAS